MSFFHSKSVSAKRVGPNLVASFATATPPLIWKFDLERNHSFTIALQGEAGDWELGITSPKGEFYPVAHFPAKEDAEEALTKVQKVLLTRNRSLFGRILLWFVGLIVLVVAAFLIGSYLITNVSLSSSAFTSLGAGAGMGTLITPPPAPPGMAPAPIGPTVIKPGVPLPADDVLRPPQ